MQTTPTLPMFVVVVLTGSSWKGARCPSDGSGRRNSSASRKNACSASLVPVWQAVYDRRGVMKLRISPLRWMLLALALAGGVVLGRLLGPRPGRAAAVPLSLPVSGNPFVNGAGQTVRLRGVSHPSFEYACQEGYAYNDGH